MARKLALLGLVLLIGLCSGIAFAEVPALAGMPLDDGADSTIGNEGSGATAATPSGATTEAEAAPVGGPVPDGAFSNEAGGPMGPAAQHSAASSFQHSALLGAFGLGAIFVSFF